MNTLTLTKPSSVRADRLKKRSAHDNEDSTYISVAETRSLLANSLAARSARLAADDLVSTDEAAEIAGASRVTVNAWIDKGRCIGLTQTKRGFRVPKWQFEPRIWSLVPKLSAALDTKDGWHLLAFLESPHGALGGNSPRGAIEQGNGARVLAIAEQEGN
ncbi:MAG: hypothetical protein H7255_10415 [Ramlibacter sp.]|nr:hypothetical protein [Ramlibacter sp.]